MPVYGIAVVKAPFQGRSESELSVAQGQRLYVNLVDHVTPSGPVRKIATEKGWTKSEIVRTSQEKVEKAVGFVPTEYLDLVEVLQVAKEEPANQTRTAKSISSAKDAKYSNANASFEKNQVVYHKRKNMWGKIEGVHTDDPEGPYYTVLLQNGNHIQATLSNLIPKEEVK
mmetsp:Transcript_1125/g.1621  ORF Transcript_1125/g.1621 Transcript_1125/m.1621 type:complete len:170 (-) Transcript_1125:3510-4019(-)